MWNDVWNDVRTTSSCEEQPVFGDSTTRPGGTCGSATTGTIYCTFKTASKHAQHSAICWAARWNARATNRSLVPLLADLLGSKLERPESPTWEEAPKLCLVLRTGWAACGTTSGTTSRRRPGAGTLAHGNRQHHNAERAIILAKKHQHECSCTWKQ